MNAYLISCEGKRYATNADNMMEAEEKLCEYLETEEIGKCQFIPVESMDFLASSADILFF